MKATTASETGSIGGSILSAFCPACVPAIGSFFTAIGLGALVNFKLLAFVTLAFLIIGIVGLYLNFRFHRKWQFLVLGAIAALGVFAGRYLMESAIVIYGSAAILIGNAFFDYKAIKNCKKCQAKGKTK